jgi:hypothetical protein
MKSQDDKTQNTAAMYGLRSCKGKIFWSRMTHRRHGLTLALHGAPGAQCGISKGTIVGSVIRERKDMTRLSYWTFSDVTWLTVSVVINLQRVCYSVHGSKSEIIVAARSGARTALYRSDTAIVHVDMWTCGHSRGINTRLPLYCVRVLVCRQRPALPLHCWPAKRYWMEMQ